MNNLKVGLKVTTIPYKQGEKTFWYDGTIMSLRNKKAQIRPFTAGSNWITIPIEDIAYVITKEKITRGGKEYTRVPVSEYTPQHTGKKRKPDGTILPDNYGGSR